MVFYGPLGHLNFSCDLFGGAVFEAVEAENGLCFFGKMAQAGLDIVHQFAGIQLIFRGVSRIGIPRECVGEVFLMHHRRFEMVDARVFHRRHQVGFEIVDLQKTAAFPQSQEYILNNAFHCLPVVDLAEGEEVHFFPVTLVNLAERQTVVVAQGFDKVFVRKRFEVHERLPIL